MWDRSADAEREPIAPFPHPDAERVITDVATLKVMANPLRQRMVAALSGPPRTVRSVAEDLGLDPHGLYYHVRLLERHGLVRVVHSEIVSGIVEKHYQASARSFLIDRTLIPPDERDSTLDPILEYVFTRTAREIRRAAQTGAIDLNVNPPHPRSLLARAGDHRLTRDEAAEFSRRLIALIEEFASRDNGQGERHLYGLSVALYPVEREDGTEAP